MAKKGGSKGGLPGLGKALSAVDTLGKQMAAERKGDYGVTLSANRAGTANLRGMTRAYARDAIANSNRQTTSLRKLAQQGQAAKRKVGNQQAATVNRYGAGLGASIANSFGVARANAAGAAANSKAAVAAGKMGGRTQQTVIGIAQAGVAAQHAAAKYSLNQALQQRTIIDNQTLAGLTGDLYKQSLAYNQQVALMKMQQEAADKAAKKAELGATQDTVRWLGERGGEMGGWLQAHAGWDGFKNEDGSYNYAAALDAYAANMGLDPANPADQSELSLMRAALRNYAKTGDATQSLTNATDLLYGGMAGWDKLSAPVLSGLDESVHTASVANELATLTAVGGSDEDHAAMRNALVLYRTASQLGTKPQAKAQLESYLTGQGYTGDRLDAMVKWVLNPNSTSSGTFSQSKSDVNGVANAAAQGLDPSNAFAAADANKSNTETAAYYAAQLAQWITPG